MEVPMGRKIILAEGFRSFDTKSRILEALKARDEAKASDVILATDRWDTVWALEKYPDALVVVTCDAFYAHDRGAVDVSEWAEEMLTKGDKWLLVVFTLNLDEKASKSSLVSGWVIATGPYLKTGYFDQIVSVICAVDENSTVDTIRSHPHVTLPFGKLDRAQDRGEVWPKR